MASLREKQEQIVCAAIEMRWVGALNLKHCEVLCGINHTQIRRSMFYQEKKCGEWQESFTHKKGFMTNKGRFVDQIEAADIALSADQLPEVNKLWDLFAEKRREKDRSGVQEMIYNKTSKILEVGVRPEDLY